MSPASTAARSCWANCSCLVGATRKEKRCADFAWAIPFGTVDEGVVLEQLTNKRVEHAKQIKQGLPTRAPVLPGSKSN